MYLKGNRWSYNKRRKRSNPWRVILLAILVGAAVYVNQVVVPSTPPLFIPTPTPTRAPESFISDAEGLLRQGKILPAIAAYQSAIEADPQNPANYVALARLQIYTGSYQEAAINAKNALLLNANNSIALALRGWAMGFTGDYLEALGSLKEAVKVDPNNAAAYAYMAEVIILQIQAGEDTLGSLNQAIEASRMAEELGPNLMETHRARGIVLEQTSNYEEAARQFEAAIAIDTNIADLHLALGRNYRALEQYERAVEEFNRANALNPSDPLPLTYISRTYATVGEYAKAIQFGEQAINISPQDAFLYGNLGTMYYRNRDYPNAITNLRLAVQGGKTKDNLEVKGLPLDYGRVAEYYYTYGLALARQEECNEAVQVSKMLLQAVREDETSVYNAEEMLNICKESVGSIATLSPNDLTGTPEPSDTPTPPILMPVSTETPES
ncbi:MAG: tetratricopeptide repeat protein [Anaerolineaceae bacterium]|nr:tetratricopeptide repeat protein [Anaerolineaceae bacterium]